MKNITILLLCISVLSACDNDKNDGTNDNDVRYISSIDQSMCDDVVVCGDLGKLDCGSAVDGPLYYFNLLNEEIISECGGICFASGPDQQEICETMCPPKEWSCTNS